MSYPTAIRKRVESLPEYKDSIKTEEKKNIIKNITVIFFVAIILAIVSIFQEQELSKWHFIILLFCF